MTTEVAAAVAEIEQDKSIIVRAADAALMLMPVMDLQMALARLKQFQAFCASYLIESKDGGADGGDYGIIPGAGAKKVLLKSGADKLCEVYGLSDDYIEISKIEDWETGLFDYTLKCVLKSRRDDRVVGSGVGCCSTFESKYRWRRAERACPECGQTAIMKSKAEWGGGWYCNRNKGGCGSKFKDGDPVIEAQEVGRVLNPDLADSKNTVLKMAKKRAKIDAVIGVTRSSGIFTQDMEDAVIADQVTVEHVNDAKEPKPAAAQQPSEREAIREKTQPQQAPQPAGGDRLISPGQGQRLWAIAREQNVPRPLVLAKIKALGFNDETEVTRKAYEGLVRWVQAGGQELTA